MDAISLTGATTLEMTSCHHDHGHSHGHSHNHSNSSNSDAIPKQVSIDELMETGSSQDQFQALLTLVKYGTYQAFQVVALAFEEKNLLDDVLQFSGREQQHSLIHWAAKRVDDVEFLEFLCQRCTLAEEQVNQQTRDDTGMRPLHWACTEGSIPHVACLLKYKANPELVDAAGCTPLLLAAQYGHANLVAFLYFQAKANLNAVDSSLDTALHWAAYKGSMAVCGFLLHQYQEINKQDSFGQTPLHLASLRGNTSVVRYLLQESSSNQKRELLYCKDHKQKTPLDLAIEKNKLAVARVLQQEMDRVDLLRVQSSNSLLSYAWKRCNMTISSCRLLFSIHACKTWLGCHQHQDMDDEAPKLPFFITVSHMIYGCLWFPIVFTPMQNVDEGLMWDKTLLHLVTLVSMMVMWISFWKTWRTNPGLLQDQHPATARLQQEYSNVLESLGSQEFSDRNEIQLCHSCHIARPLRSKHCRVSRRCVLVFDHYCPFVGNTIGLYNYKWFYLFLWSLLFSLIGFFWEWIVYMTRLSSFSWSVFFGGLYMLIFFGMDVGMVVYHSQLVLTNLTTNEHLNLTRYKYLQHDNGRFRNPFDKGWLWNCIERCTVSPNQPQAYTTTAVHVNSQQQPDQEQASLVRHADGRSVEQQDEEEDGDIV